MNKFRSQLQSEILLGLPGTAVQWQMAPSDRTLKNFPGIPGKDSLSAAVLILLYPLEGSVHTVFIQRHNYIGVHGGQISFPGGKREPVDENITQTAIREAKEETGINPSEVSVIGTLTPLFIPVSNMIVTPVVGWMNSSPSFNFQPEEVAFLIDADLRTLMDQTIVKTRLLEIRGEMVNVKYYDYKGNVIWGATAMILRELLTIIGRGNISLEV